MTFSVAELGNREILVIIQREPESYVNSQLIVLQRSSYYSWWSIYNRGVNDLFKNECGEWWRKDTNRCLQIGHVNEYPTMHYFRNPRHRQSLIAYMILIYLFILIIDTMHTPRSYFIHHFLGFEDDAKEPLIQLYLQFWPLALSMCY